VRPCAEAGAKPSAETKVVAQIIAKPVPEQATDMVASPS